MTSTLFFKPRHSSTLAEIATLTETELADPSRSGHVITGIASLDEAEKRDTGKGEFWFAVITRKGGPTEAALPGVLDAALKALPWPKSMKWGSGTMQWVRPLQSIVALFDGKVLPGQVTPGGDMHPVPYGDSTTGHRFLSKGSIKVAGFADYEKQLKGVHVVLDPAERKKIILDGAQKLVQQAQVSLKDDEGLLEEVAGLVEWPVALMGSFDAAFLSIPDEVIRATIRANQKCFVVYDPATSKLANKFILTANIEASDGAAAINTGIDSMLLAPFDRDTFVRRVNELAFNRKKFVVLGLSKQKSS